jgi:hypothetical protein
MSEKFPQQFAGMLSLAVALIVAAIIGYGAIDSAKRSGDTITATGSAKKSITSDIIIWRGSTSSRKPTMQEAYSEVKRYSERVKAYFREQGIPDSVVSFQGVNTNEIQEILPGGHRTGRIVAYQISQSFNVQSGDVERITKLSSDASELINDGIPISSNPPEFIYSGLASVRVGLLAEAAQDARRRAETIAQAVGSNIGVVRSARMGVFQITPRNSTMVSDYGINDTSSREKDVTAVVSVTFAVD